MCLTITKTAISYSIASVDEKIIDEINILNATKLAIGSFIVPYIFCMNPAMLLIDVTVAKMIMIIITSSVGKNMRVSSKAPVLNIREGKKQE